MEAFADLPDALVRDLLAKATPVAEGVAQNLQALRDSHALLYTEARADSERGDAFIADRNRTVAQLQADLEAERERCAALHEEAVNKHTLWEAEREKVKRLREALLAAKVMWDRGDHPIKLDEAITWRENDERVNEMVAAALAATADEDWGL